MHREYFVPWANKYIFSAQVRIGSGLLCTSGLLLSYYDGASAYPELKGTSEVF